MRTDKNKLQITKTPAESEDYAAVIIERFPETRSEREITVSIRSISLF